MSDFRPVSTHPPLYVFDAGGKAHTVFGWYDNWGAWTTIIPVVANPDGPGIGPWNQYYGSDPWTVSCKPA